MSLKKEVGVEEREEKQIAVFIFGKKYQLVLDQGHSEVHLKKLAAGLEAEVSKMRAAISQRLSGALHHQDLLTLVALNLLEGQLFYQAALEKERELKEQLHLRLRKLKERLLMPKGEDQRA